MGAIPLLIVLLGYGLHYHYCNVKPTQADFNFFGDHLMLVAQGLMILLFSLIWIGSHHDWARHHMKYRESTALLLLSLVGAIVLCGAANLLNIYIGIELVSFPIFALIALQENSRNATSHPSSTLS